MRRPRPAWPPRPGAGAGMVTGSVTLARSPPSGRASSRSPPPCASAMAATIDRPRPAPPGPVRSAPSRRNGWPSPATWAGSSTAPPFSTTSRAWRPAPVVATVVATRIQPPARLWPIALSSRLSIIWRSSGWLPRTQQPSGPLS